MSEKLRERKFVPLSEAEQNLRKPLPVGVLLSGISKPIPVSEQVRRVKVRKS